MPGTPDDCCHIPAVLPPLAHHVDNDNNANNNADPNNQAKQTQSNHQYWEPGKKITTEMPP